MFQRLLVVLTPGCVYHYQAVSLDIVLADHFHEMISQPSSPSIYPSQEELRVLHLHLFSMAPASSFPLPGSPVVSLHTQAVQYQLNCAIPSSRDYHDATDSSLRIPVLIRIRLQAVPMAQEYRLNQRDEYPNSPHSGCHAGTRLYIKQSPHGVRQTTDTCRSWSKGNVALVSLLSSE